MTSWVDIANNALTRLGSRNIISLNEEKRSARLCKVNYKPAAEIILRSFPWSCIGGRTQLAPVVAAPPFGYTHAFELPADCIRVNFVNGTTFGYKVEGKRILANTTLLELEYNINQTDPAQYDVLLIEAIGLSLAVKICLALTNDKGINDRLEMSLAKAMRMGKFVDSCEDASGELEITTFTNARQGQGQENLYRQ